MGGLLHMVSEEGTGWDPSPPRPLIAVLNTIQCKIGIYVLEQYINNDFKYLYLCQGYVPLTLDVMRVAFKVPLAFHTPL